MIEIIAAIQVESLVEEGSTGRVGWKVRNVWRHLMISFNDTHNLQNPTSPLVMLSTA